jgi:hypothetical protein
MLWQPTRGVLQPNQSWRRPQGAAAPSYAGGPGDIISFPFWYGLRGYSIAYATGSNPAIDVVDQSGANSLTVNILASGDLDAASISAWVSANSVTTILVSKLYDQVGSAHLTQTTNSRRPSLVLAGYGAVTKPVMLFNHANNQDMVGTSGAALNQPWTYHGVFNRPVYVQTSSQFHGNFCGINFGNGASYVQLYAGASSGAAGATDNVWHSFMGIANGASGMITVDATDTTVNAGTTAFGTSLSLGTYNGSGGNSLNGYCGECGTISGATSSTNRTAIYSNQKTYWGY